MVHSARESAQYRYAQRCANCYRCSEANTGGGVKAGVKSVRSPVEKSPLRWGLAADCLLVIAGLCGLRAAVSASRRCGRHSGEAGFGAGPVAPMDKLCTMPMDSPAFGTLKGLTPACPQVCAQLAPPRSLRFAEPAIATAYPQALGAVPGGRAAQPSAGALCGGASRPACLRSLSR